MPASGPTASTPTTGDPIPEMGHKAKPEAKKPATPQKKLDLNSATIDELKTIPGVGDAEAKKIVANRPYGSKAELVSKAGLPEGIYVSARHRVEARPVKQSGAKKTASTTDATSGSTKPAKATSQKSESPKSETKQ